MRQSKSLGSLALPVGGPLRRKSGPKEAPDRVFPAAADAYELLEDCGRGVSATVWRARCLTNSEIVAVKILNLEAQMAPLEDIVHEAQTMKAYKHESILGLHVCFVHQTQLWMVMPYMEGGSVAHIMRYRYPDGLSEPVIATIMKEVLSALAYIHSHGDIHRDVKAGNVLVAGEGQTKLGDFGVAASMERQDWGAPQGRNTFAGTPCWMAPEVLEQDRYGPKADIWSAGITMLEMAHGHAPFSKLPPIKVLLLTLQGPPPQLEAECGGRHFSRGMREVVASCLNKDPAKRPTAKQLLSKGFFRQAKDTEYMKRTVLAGLPPLPQRCMEIRMGKGRAATLALENDRAALASKISYFTDVAQWDFKCSKSDAAGGSATDTWACAAGDTAAAATAATASLGSYTDSLTSTAATAAGSSSSPSRAVSSRGDQHIDQPQLQQQHLAAAGQGAGVSSVLGSSASLDVPGQQQQQGVVGLEGLFTQQQQQQQVGGDVGPGARDVDTGSGGADSGRGATDTAAAAVKVALPVRQYSPMRQPHSPRTPPPAAAAAAATSSPTSSGRKVLTCYAGGKTITTFPVSVPNTPDHSPMHSRPNTPEMQAAAAAAAAGAAGCVARVPAVSYPGAAAADTSAASSVVAPGAKKQGRFTYVEGSARYQGPDLALGSPTAAAAAAGGTQFAGGRGHELLKQRSVSSPEIALLFNMQGLQSSSGSSGLRDAPVSPVSPPAPAPAAAAANSAMGDSGRLSPRSQQQQQPGAAIPPVQSSSAAAAAAGSSLSPRAQQQLAAADVHSPARPSSPAAGNTGSLFAKLLPHKAGDAVSPRRPQSPLGSPSQQQQPEHHEYHALQHKIAGFFTHHGLGKASKNASPLSSRDGSPYGSRHGVHDAGANSSSGASRLSYAGAEAAGPAAGCAHAAATAAGGSSSAGMGALDRRGGALQDIYHDSYCSSRDAAKSPRSGSPRTPAHGRASAAAGTGAKEHATAAQIWQHVKEACAETASDVAHIFRSHSGGSLHQQERSNSRSPERPPQQQQQQEQPMPPPSPRTLFTQPVADGIRHQQQQELEPAEAAAARDAKQVTNVAAAAAAGVGHTGSSSNLVRLGSRGSIPAVSLAEMVSGGSSSSSSSSSKPPRYQQGPARTASREQLMKQPLSPQRQPLSQQQQQQAGMEAQQQHVAMEPQVSLKQQLLSQQQQEVQLELEAMQQQEGIPEEEVQEAAAAVTTLAAAAEAVEQAAAAAGGGGGVGREGHGSGSPVAVGVKPTMPLGGHSDGGSAFANQPHLGSDGGSSGNTDSNSLAPAAQGLSLVDLGSRELSFAPGSGTLNRSSSGGGGATAAAAAAAAAAADRLSSHALDSPEKQQQEEEQQGLAVESSVTFPKVAGWSSVDQSILQQQKLEAAAATTPAAAGGAGAVNASEAATCPTLLNLRGVASVSEDQLRGRPMLTAADAAAAAAAADGASMPGRRQQQGRSTGVSAEPRSVHTSASPSRRHKGRFTITET